MTGAREPAQRLVAEARGLLGADGLDIVHPFDLGWWREAPRLGPSGQLGLLVGSTRTLWRALPTQRPAAEHPIDAHVEAALQRAASRLGLEVLALAHGSPPFFPIQRLAHAAGLGELGPARLLVHPEYGPWLGLRAVLGTSTPSGLPPEGPPAPPRPCHGCAAPCVERLEAAASGAGPPSPVELRRRWRAFAEVRLVCPLGRAHRYSDAEIEYHYAGLGWPNARAPDPGSR